MQDKERLFSALRIRDFRLFWSSQLISLSGTWMQQVAVGWLVYSITKSPFYLGLTITLMSVPVLLFTLLGGITADRYPKRNIIIATQTMFILPAFLLGYLSEMQQISMAHVFLLVFFIGILNAFDTPARQSYIIELVGKDNLLNAIALNSAAFNGARVIGPVLAGILIAKMGIQACFYINALSFLPVVGALFTIRVKGNSSAVSRSSFTKELGEGLHYIRNQRGILFLFTVIALISLFGIPYSSFLPVIAQDILHTGAKGLGRLAGSAGAGALIAAVLIAVKGTIGTRFAHMSAALVSSSLSIFVLTFSKSEVLSCTLLFFAGWGIVSFLAIGNNFIQQTVPDSLRGRVMSAYVLVFLGMSPFGNLVVGAMADALGTMKTLRITGLICILITLFFIKYESRSRMRGTVPRSRT